MKRSVTAKRFQRFNEIRLPLRSIVLAAFFLLGVMFGCAAAQRAKSVVGEELAAYLQRFAELANGSLPGASLIFESGYLWVMSFARGIPIALARLRKSNVVA